MENKKVTTMLNLRKQDYHTLLVNGFLKLEFEHRTVYMHTELVEHNNILDLLIHVHEVNFSPLYKRLSTSPKINKHFYLMSEVALID